MPQDTFTYEEAVKPSFSFEEAVKHSFSFEEASSSSEPSNVPVDDRVSSKVMADMLAPGPSQVSPQATDIQHPNAIQPFPTEPLINIKPDMLMPPAAMAAVRYAATALGPKAEKFESGFEKGAAETLSGFTTPESLATMPAFLVPYVGQALALYMGGKATYEGTKNFIEAVKEGDYEKAGRAIPEVGVGLMMLYGGAKSAKEMIKPAAELPPKIPTVGEVLAPQTTQALQETKGVSAQVAPTPEVPNLINEVTKQTQAEVKAITTETEVKNAIPEQKPNAEVLRQPQPEVGLQEMGTRNAQPKVAAEPQKTLPPAAETPPANVETLTTEQLPTTEGEVKTKSGEAGVEAQPASMGGGAAEYGEVGTGASADIYGIAQRIREQRAKAGQTVQIDPGQGVSAVEAVVRGQTLLESDPAAAQKAVDAFTQTKAVSYDGISATRAAGEKAFRDARRIEEQFGTDSPEYRAAFEEGVKWDKASKEMQTEWHKTGRAQQGQTDIDTGTFTGLQRAHQEATGHDFTPEQKPKAEKVAKEVKDANTEEQNAKKNLNDELKNQVGPEENTPEQMEQRAQELLDSVKPESPDLAKVEAGLKSLITERTPAEQRAFDAAARTVRESAARAAKAEAEAREIDAQRDKDVAAIEAKNEARIQAAVDKAKRDAATRAAKAETEARVKAAQSPAELEAIAKANEERIQKVVDKVKTDAASRASKKEVADRVAKAANEKKFAEAERANALSKQKKAWAEIRQRAIKAAEQERKNAADPARHVWRTVRSYIDKGVDNFDEIRNKVATDLGMSVEKVTQLMAQTQRVKFLADEFWRKQQTSRRLREQAKRWLENLEIPTLQKALQSIPKILFGLKVGFHGTVALGTHAPMVAFQPRFWTTYVRDFGKMYKMVANPAYYEMQIQDLMRRPNYITARRAGLVNDPFVYEDFNSPDTAKYFGNLSGMGNRGYSILKILRQDMFDQIWNQLPKTTKIPEVAEAIADGLNHVTGVVKGRAPAGTNLALFAPRLEGSRVMWLAGDTLRAGDTFLRWKDSTLAEKTFAMNWLKERAWVAGTLFSLLALNQGFLSATGSKQKINGIPEEFGGGGIDPLSGDFLKFKVAGMDVAYGSAMLNMAKLPPRIATAIMFEGKTSKLILEDERVYKILGDYLRSQMSPFAGTATDLALGRDYAGRPLPRAGFGLLKGRTDIPKRLKLHGIDKPYSWAEYSSIQFTPIPISEGIREVWGQGLGMSDSQINHYLKGWAITSLMAGTGARITEDRPKHIKTTP